MGNAIEPTGHDIATNQMTFAPRLILYTNKLTIPFNEIVATFDQVNILVEVVQESKMFQTLFISYGGPDEEKTSKINSYLKSKGIKTWFFPDDALPGEKLHRVMHNGVSSFDRILLICSENSLTRPGFLNELERVLEREAREGGTDILIPLTLDDYVYKNWAPNRPDLAEQIRSRVIGKIQFEENPFSMSMNKVVQSLRKK